MIKMAEKKTEKELSFEEAVKQLEELVKKLEEGELSLEKSMAVYEQGVKLTAICNRQLKSAKLKIEELKNNSNEQ